MLVFNNILIFKALNIFTYINQHQDKTDIFTNVGITPKEHSLTYIFNTEQNENVRILISDNFDSYSLSYMKSSETEFTELAKFGSSFPLSLELDIKFLNESFLEDLEEKTFSIEKHLHSLLQEAEA